MNEITKKQQRIRELVNHLKQRELILSDKVKWNKTCSCMDVIGDSQIAIEDYFKLTPFSYSNGGYLFLYGLLQAFFLQQDAINHLSLALFDIRLDWKNDYPDLYKIRELRNDAIGHPTNRNNNKSFHFITRYSLNKDYFELASHYPKDGIVDYREINIAYLKEKQEKSIVSFLNKIISKMEIELKNHKIKFLNMRLVDIIPDTWKYDINKIYEGVYNNHPLAKIHFNIICEIYDNLKKGIIERYGSINSFSGVSEIVRKIDYIIKKLENWILKNELVNNYDAEVFLDCLVYRFSEFKEILIEIDDEFKKV